MGDEIHTHTFRANQPHYLLQPVLQRLGRTGEQQVCLVKKQRQQRFFRITAFRQLLEQLSEQPEQECRVYLRRFVNQTTGIQQVNTPATVSGWLQDVFELQRRFAEQRFSALLFQRCQTPQQSLT
ncbi:hypothetical protein D3C85_1542750 [compost metagenome]